MSEEEILPVFKAGAGRSSALFALVHEDLSIYSVDDLQERIETLETEIQRARGALDKKKNGRSAADALFSFKGS